MNVTLDLEQGELLRIFVESDLVIDIAWSRTVANSLTEEELGSIWEKKSGRVAIESVCVSMFPVLHSSKVK